MISQEEYVKIDGMICPECESEDLKWSPIRIGSGGISQRVHCQNCDSSWYDEYELSGYTSFRPGENYLIFNGWTFIFQQQALKDGWGIFAADGRRDNPAIQMNDSADIFASDDEAKLFVAAGAANGDSLCQLALEVVCKNRKEKSNVP